MLYKIQQHPIKPHLHFQNRPTVDGIFLDKNVIIRATIDSTSVVVLADIGLFFCRPKTFVSVGPFIVIYFFLRRCPTSSAKTVVG